MTDGSPAPDVVTVKWRDVAWHLIKLEEGLLRCLTLLASVDSGESTFLLREHQVILVNLKRLAADLEVAALHADISSEDST